MIAFVGLERFRAKWIPVRVKKTRLNKVLVARMMVDVGEISIIDAELYQRVGKPDFPQWLADYVTRS